MLLTELQCAVNGNRIRTTTMFFLCPLSSPRHTPSQHPLIVQVQPRSWRTLPLIRQQLHFNGSKGSPPERCQRLSRQAPTLARPAHVSVRSTRITGLHNSNAPFFPPTWAPTWASPISTAAQAWYLQATIRGTRSCRTCSIQTRRGLTTRLTSKISTRSIVASSPSSCLFSRRIIRIASLAYMTRGVCSWDIRWV